MKLFSSPNSPYARKCRVIIIEKGLEQQVQLVQADPYVCPPDLLSVNPLSKIPALLTDDGLAICDSPLICEYLDQLPSSARPLFPASRKEHFPVLALAALADGLLDVTLELRYQQLQPLEKQWPERMQAREQAILRTLDSISRHALPGDEILNIGTLTLACALAYLHFRQPQIQWEYTYPELDKWLAHVLKRPSFQQTMPPG